MRCPMVIFFRGTGDSSVSLLNKATLLRSSDDKVLSSGCCCCSFMVGFVCLYVCLTSWWWKGGGKESSSLRFAARRKEKTQMIKPWLCGQTGEEETERRHFALRLTKPFGCFGVKWIFLTLAQVMQELLSLIRQRKAKEMWWWRGRACWPIYYLFINLNWVELADKDCQKVKVGTTPKHSQPKTRYDLGSLSYA